MANPISMGTGLAGGLIQLFANLGDRKNMYNAYLDELNKQRGFQQQGYDMFSRQMPAFGEEQAQKDLASGSASRVGTTQRLQGNALFAGATPMSLSTQGKLDLSNQSAANYNAYGDWEQQQANRQQTLGNDINRNSFASRGEAATFPFTLQHAQHSMDWLSMIGSLIQAVGGSGGVIASAGGGGSGGSGGGDFGYSMGGGAPGATLINSNSGYSPF